MTVFREDHAVVVRIPVNFRRRNGRQMVLTYGGEERPAKPDRQVNGALVTAVAKAYRWQEQLESGQYASLEALAAAHGVDRSYAGRILRLTSLSPEIVEAILDGNEPKGLTLAKLHKRLPLIWSEQALGLTALRHRWYVGREFYVATAMAEDGETTKIDPLRKLLFSRNFRRGTR